MASLEQPSKTSSVGNSKTDSTGSSVNIAIECAMSGKVARFIQCFDNENDPFHDTVAAIVSARSNEDNRSPLDWAALIGNVAMVSELIKRGADVNAVSEKGKLNDCKVITANDTVLKTEPASLQQLLDFHLSSFVITGGTAWYALDAFNALTLYFMSQTVYDDGI